MKVEELRTSHEDQLQELRKGFPYPTCGTFWLFYYTVDLHLIWLSGTSRLTLLLCAILASKQVSMRTHLLLISLVLESNE